jgi:S1-C subfamily serine protease
MRRDGTLIGPVVVTALLGFCHGTIPATAKAQEREAVAKQDAALVVDGLVREVFRSPRQGQVDYLVQIEVRRSAIGQPPRSAARLTFPAPGESIYVHVFQTTSGSGRGGYRSIPSERTDVRAYLTPRAQGGWEGTFPEWFDVTANQPASAGPTDTLPPSVDNPPTPAPTGSGSKVVVSSLGVMVETLDVGGRTALRVSSVERGGPAQKAGIEVGDIIAGANKEPIATAQQLDELARRGGALSLIVVDVNTGKGVQVPVTTGRTTEGGPPIAVNPRTDDRNVNGDTAPGTGSAPRSLGITAEPVTIGQRTALKIVRVEPGSPAHKAGLERDDILVGANGAPLTGPEQLATALRKSGPTLTLLVRDSRTGKDVPVEVNIGGPASDSSPLPIPLPRSNDPAPGGGLGGTFGAVTELSFYDVEAAVKVTEVDPGSPAAAAGIQPGLIILQANGVPILHPNELVEAVRKSGPTLKLSVVDPRNGRKRMIDVNLRR